MSAIPSPSQSGAIGGNAEPPATDAEIDSSCRAPLLFLFVSAAAWLLIGSLFAIVATLKFHSPNLLADCPFLTYGRVHPAHLNAWIYGFGAQAGLGVMLWLCCHLGRTRLAFAPGVAIGAIFWNVGVTAGILGILCGENTGYEWLEMPRYASVTLLLAYLVIGVGGLVTFQRRTEMRLYISQWFLLAAFFWFPWIYTTGNLLLVANPVRGVLQAVVDWWYIHNLTTIWFGFVGLAAAFYFIPKIIKRPLSSHYYGILVFWMLIFFGSWGGIPTGAPVPAWISALSTMAGVLTIIPVLAVAMIWRRTFAGDYSAMRQSVPLKFILFGAVAYVIAGLAAVAMSFDEVSKVVGFTWAVPAQTLFFIYGFFSMTMFGAIYYIVPRLTGSEFSAGGVKAHFWLAGLGILIYAVPLAMGGVNEGITLNTMNGPFLEAANSILPYLRASTLGDFFMAAGHVVFLLNLIGLLVRVSRTSALTFVTANTKRLEAAS